MDMHRESLKRRREMEKGSEIRLAIEELSMVMIKVKPGDGDQGAVASHIPTSPFLSVCKFILQILDKIGPTMVVLRQDMDQNIQRLEKVHEAEPMVYSNVVEILKKEGNEGNSRKNNSCSRAFLWLTRALDFTLGFLQLLVKDFGQSIEQIVEEAYKTTLRQWHGWISSTAYRVALKLVPDNKTLMNVLMAEDEDIDVLKNEMEALISSLLPLLEHSHSVLRSYGLDRLKCT